MYINETVPRSNKEAHTHYYLLVEDEGIQRAETLQDTEHIAEMAARTHKHIKKAVRVRYGVPEDFTPETYKERFDRDEGRDRCKRIAEEVNAYAEGLMHKCPECGETVEIPDNGGDRYKCPHCGEVFDRDDAEQCGIYDYMEDILDIEFKVDSRKEYKSCEIWVGLGGPNICIDTSDAYIKLYWGNTREQYPIKYDTNSEIDTWAEDYYNCI